MARPKSEVRDFRGMAASPVELSRFLQINERTFYRMVDKGVLPKGDDGAYHLGDVTDAYWQYQYSTEGLKAARTRLVAAQADMAELELAEQRGEMHRGEAVAKVWGGNVMNAKTRLLAIPAKIAPEMVGKGLTEIQAMLKEAIGEALKELSGYDARRISRASASLRK